MLVLFFFHTKEKIHYKTDKMQLTISYPLLPSYIKKSKNKIRITDEREKFEFNFTLPKIKSHI